VDGIYRHFVVIVGYHNTIRRVKMVLIHFAYPSLDHLAHPRTDLLRKSEY
jgi:hypothetical protein